jgi:hypothetical protein
MVLTGSSLDNEVGRCLHKLDGVQRMRHVVRAVPLKGGLLQKTASRI